MPPLEFSDRAIHIVAEDKILAAIERGDFDHLPGLGKPDPRFEKPYDPYSWVREKVKQEALAPRLFTDVPTPPKT